MPSENEYQLSPEDRAVIDAMVQQMKSAQDQVKTAQDKISGALEFLHARGGHNWEWLYSNGTMTKKSAT